MGIKVMAINIELQICALVMMTVLVIMFLREKKLALVHHKLFAYAMISSCICLLFDIVSIICIYANTIHSLSDTHTAMACKLYLISLLTQGFLSTVYVLAGILPTKIFTRNISMVIYLGIYLIACICISILPIYWVQYQRNVYSYGAAPVFAYDICAVFLVSISISLICARNRISARRFHTILLWMFVWFLGALIQYFNKSLLVIGFASALGMIILYLRLENPNEYLDVDTGIFNRQALSLFINDRYRYHKNFTLFTCKIKYLTTNVDYALEQVAITRVTKALLNLGKYSVFLLDDDTFCVAFEMSDDMPRVFAHMLLEAEAVKDFPAVGKYVVVDDGMKFTGPDEFFKMLHMCEVYEDDILYVNDDIIKQMRAKTDIYQMIDEALKDDRIEVYYQPFYDNTTGTFSAAEALVRIRSKEGNLIYPGSFIEVAEENGQIIALGLRVFEKVCEFIATTDVTNLGLSFIEVNISAAQFDHDNPAKFVTECLSRYHIDPSHINLEITETAVSKNKHVLIKNMETLIEKGVYFSLDDFGTGRSNLDYFVSLPVKNIKFDYSFTQGYFVNHKVRVILKGMVTIMHDMHINIVAEGIETKEQFDAMKQLGIKYIQGYYFSKPVSADEFLKFLAKNNNPVEVAYAK